jgi:hypothetical protein
MAGQAGDAYTQEHPATQVHAALTQEPGEPVIVKRRVSAFTGSDLDVLLRGAGADALILAGISTSGVVLSTLRQAADLDYRLTVLADACADLDPEVHRVLTEKIFPRQALVTTTDDWIASLLSGDKYVGPIRVCDVGGPFRVARIWRSWCQVSRPAGCGRQFLTVIPARRAVRPVCPGAWPPS